MVFDVFQVITTISACVAIIWGVFEIRNQVKKRSEGLETRLITAIDTRLGTVKQKIDDNEKAFIAHVTDKEKLILTLKDDIKLLEEHLAELCKTVAKHEGILESVNPVIMAVQNNISELKVKVELMEKGISH